MRCSLLIAAAVQSAAMHTLRWPVVRHHQGLCVKLLGLLLTWSAGQPLAKQNGLGSHTLAGKAGIRVDWSGSHV
jgi:hypothetical protein